MNNRKLSRIHKINGSRICDFVNTFEKSLSMSLLVSCVYRTGKNLNLKYILTEIFSFFLKFAQWLMLLFLYVVKICPIWFKFYSITLSTRSNRKFLNYSQIGKPSTTFKNMSQYTKM